MKKKSKVLAVVAAILSTTVLLAACGSTNSAAQKGDADSQVKTIKIATDGDTAPYAYKDTNGEVVGFEPAVLKAVFEKLPQYKPEFVVTEWSSIMTGVTSDIYQIGMNNFSYTPERGEQFLYSYPTQTTKYIFAVTKGKKVPTSFEECAGLTFEGTAGIGVTTAVENYNKEHPDKAINLKYSEAAFTAQLQHVSDGTSDLLILDEPMLNAYSKQYNFDFDYGYVPDGETGQLAANLNSYFLFSLDSEDLRAEINQAIKELYEDGTIAKLSQEYLEGDFSAKADEYEKTLN